MKKIIIAIDGFSSCGKSTMAKDLAKLIGYIFIDSGAMYRAMTLFCIDHQLIDNDKVDEDKLKKEIDSIKIEFKIDAETGLPNTYLNGTNVEHQIRSMEVSNKVSIISAVGFIRKAMVHQQQEMGKAKGIVMDGRDIGTVVFPSAELKIFVTASPNIRAQRRLDELRSKGDNITTLDEVLQNIKTRDHLDQTRTESPLVQAEDAIVLDNSNITIAEQTQWLLEQWKQKTE